MFDYPRIKIVEWLLILLYFFLNSFLLPNGLLYTTLLTPLFMYVLYQKGIYQYIFWFVGLMIPFAIVQIWMGVDMFYYLKSSALLFTTLVFILFVYDWAKEFQMWDSVMRTLLYITTLLAAVAMIFYFSPKYIEVWWWVRNLTPGVHSFPRLKLLTYEASYLALLLVPLVCYFVFNAIIPKNFKTNLIPLFLLGILLTMSLSFGVIGGLILSLSPIVFVVLYKKWGITKFLWVCVFVLSLICLISMSIYHVFPESALVTRINNIIQGNDSSFTGRTTESFGLANVLLQMKSPWWGVGPGQIKVLGVELWQQVYNVPFNVSNVNIPNASAETLAIFGYIGLLLRLSIQVVLFVKTKVYENAFRLSLFLFIFIYQFTGSYIVNLAEYMIWILAFVPQFKAFNFNNFKLKHENSISI